ncbi:GNAT family N-acetyltransferase [Agrilutibacter solisilvae]|uniref:GNAT family N-acetyltransferase n=1 Tax=Agrilutibacter solisilvae TaxID=2763317 RepID=A0A974XZR4_9GAMM|nr:GNAT family N-acetyltransferase [Lysobacter solisilvae]QSX78771.1 GNAT family N-acetyltransferase [Lysobacter solisilvae]
MRARPEGVALSPPGASRNAEDPALPEMRTARLRLRPLAAGDEALYERIYCDPVLMAQVADPLPPAAARDCFTRIVQGRAPRWRLWVMHEAAQDVDIGLAALVTNAQPRKGADVGSMVLPAWQRRGYTVEALRQLATHAFEVLGLPMLVGRHAATNAGSIAVLRRLGFRPVPVEPTDRFDARFDLRWELTAAAWRGYMAEELAAEKHSPGHHRGRNPPGA